MNYAVSLSLAVCIAFLVHDFLQEKLVVQEGFSFGTVVTLVEFLSLVVLPGCKSAITGSAKLRLQVTRPLELSAVAISILVSILCSNLAVNFVHYPIKVALKSGKLIPTMAIGTLILGRKQSMMDYFGALLLCGGLCGFTLTDYFNMGGDQEEQDRAAHDLVYGCGLLLIAITFEAALPSMQENLMKNGENSLSPEEMLMYSNLMAAVLVFFGSLAQGEFLPACTMLADRPRLCLVLLVYATSTYVGVSIYTHLIREAGGVMAVVVTTLRKVVTITLSFVVFPDGKPFSPWYFLWGCVVIAGVLVGARAKEQRKRAERRATLEAV